jgi:hypothetical protein
MASKCYRIAARSSNRHLVNSSVFSARLRHRSACAFRKFVSMLSPTELHALTLHSGQAPPTEQPLR